MKSRRYQVDAQRAVLDSFQKHQSCLLVMATGLGKTHCAFKIANEIMGDKRVFFMVHEKNLLEQAFQECVRLTGIIPGVERAHERTDESWELHRHKIVIGTVQTLNSRRGRGYRMDKFCPADFGLFVADEIHHGAANTWRRAIDHFASDDCKILGLTATPNRHDGKSISDIFDDCPYQYHIHEAINDGWLANVVVKRHFLENFDISRVSSSCGDFNGKELDDVIQRSGVLAPMARAIFDATPETKTLVFVGRVRQAQQMSNIFNSFQDGCSAWICGDTGEEERETTVKQFKASRLRYLLNVGVCTEGFDVRDIGCVAQCSPTKSLTKYIQMMGRGTRPLLGVVDDIWDDEQNHLGIEGETNPAAIRRQRQKESAKPNLLLIDFVGNCGRHKVVTAYDALGSNYTDRERQRAAALSLHGNNGPIFAAKTLKNARDQLAHEDEIDIRKMRELRVRAQYRVKDLSPFDANGGAGREKQPKSRAWIAPQVRNRLEARGQWRNDLTAAGASWLLKHASPKQQTHLARHGFRTDLLVSQACKIMDVLSNNGWRWPENEPKPEHLLAGKGTM